MTPRPHRVGWPWPSVPSSLRQAEDALRDSHAKVTAAALRVGSLTDDLLSALKHLEQAQAEAHAACEGAATDLAQTVIDHARRRPA